MISQLLCLANKQIIDVLGIIDNNAKGVAFIVDDNQKLIGVISDGDIRRHLLLGGNINESLRSLIKPDFVYARREEAYNEMFKKIDEKIRVFPIVDEDFKVIDYFEYKTGINIPISIPDLSGKEFDYLLDAFSSTWISSRGKYIDAFEREFAVFCECNSGIAVSNGTAALHLALVALGIGEGDEVVVPDMTFAATINAVLHARAIPVIVDIEKDSWCIDPREIEKAITPKTKAINPVHLFGQPCDMAAIMNIANRYNLYVIEDCAQAHGARYNGKKVGSFGNIGCFSFFGNKVITTGEGGMCVTNDSHLDGRLRLLRDHGMSRTKKYWHECIGYNYRMTNLQAAIGLAQLERVESILKKRSKIESDYRDYFAGNQSIEFQRNDINLTEKITWLVCILVDLKKRDFIIEKLKGYGIDIRPFFYSLSSMPIYNQYKFSSRNSEEVSQRGINFPTNYMVTESILSDIGKLLSVN